jgi:hypothetical protein
MTVQETKDMYYDMKNDELAQLIEDFDLTVESKNPKKPNKQELVDTLIKFKVSQDKANGIEVEEEPELEADVPAGASYIGKTTITQKKLTASQKLAMKMAELTLKRRVMVHDTITTQTRDELAFVRWGNRGMGYQRDYVNITGKVPQYVRVGALEVLKEVMLSEYVQDDHESKMILETRPRYTIMELEGLSEEEILLLATQQNMRNAKFAK